MSWGVTSAGFVAKTLEEVKTEIETALKAAFGESIDLSPESNFGQLVGVLAERDADLWALAEAAYLAFTRDGATGSALDAVGALTGTVREPARPSTVTITATGTPGTVLASGRGVSVVTVGTKFQTTAGGTLVAAAAWAGTTAYALGARVTNSNRVYQCITAGTSAGAGGPTTTASSIADGTAVWRYLGEGTGVVDIAAESVDDGPKVALSGTLTVIDTPVAGWSSVINVLDATLGADLESDAAYRIRQESELRATGKAAVEAIRSALLQVEGVAAVTVFENVTDATDGDGLPPHSVEALVECGTSAAVAKELWNNVAAGIQTHGGVTESVTDSQGIAHTVKFSRPTEVPIWLIVNVTVDSGTWPADGADQVKAAIVAWGDAQKTGKDAVASAVVAQAFKVSGVLDAAVLIGTANPPVSSATVAISLRQLATYDTSRITVNATPGTP